MCWPEATCAEPWNITCSKRWANPVRPCSSSREPTSYQMLTATDGAMVPARVLPEVLHRVAARVRHAAQRAQVDAHRLGRRGAIEREHRAAASSPQLLH